MVLDKQTKEGKGRNGRDGGEEGSWKRRLEKGGREKEGQKKGEVGVK